MVPRWLVSLQSRYKAGFMVVLFCFINLINYLDRGIIPGAENNGIFDFLATQVGKGHEDFMLGIVQSSYIVGYAVASVIFGRLVHTFHPMRMTAFGLLMWVISAVVSGLSASFCSGDGSCPGVYILVVGRILSGIGEASFQCVIPPFIDDNAPKGKKSLWLAAFFCCIPVGTALGFAYASKIATAPAFAGQVYAWRYAFFIEAGIMFPFVLFCFSMPAKFTPDGVPITDADSQRLRSASETKPGFARTGSGKGPFDSQGLTAGLLENDMEQARTLPASREDESISELSTVSVATTATTKGDRHSSEMAQTFGEELKVILTSVPFIFAALGYASFTFVLSGLSSFGPTILSIAVMHPECDPNTPPPKTNSSVLFGGLIALAGLVGTFVGGLIVDKCMVKARRRAEMTLVASMESPPPPQRVAAAAINPLNHGSPGSAPRPIPPAPQHNESVDYHTPDRKQDLSMFDGVSPVPATNVSMFHFESESEAPSTGRHNSFPTSLRQGLDDHLISTLRSPPATVNVQGSINAPSSQPPQPPQPRRVGDLQREGTRPTSGSLPQHPGQTTVHFYPPNTARPRVASWKTKGVSLGPAVAGSLGSLEHHRGQSPSSVSSDEGGGGGESRGNGGNTSGGNRTLAASDVSPFRGVDADDISSAKHYRGGGTHLEMDLRHQREGRPRPPHHDATGDSDLEETALAHMSEEDLENSQPMLDAKLCSSMPVNAWGITLGFITVIAAPLAVSTSDVDPHVSTLQKVLFFVFMFLGGALLFVTTASINVSVMASVPPDNRSLAIGVSTIIMHVLGDVPSPPIIGALADALSPVEDNIGECRSVSGLRITFLISLMWLLSGVVFWILGTVASFRRRKKHERTLMKGGALRNNRVAAQMIW